MIQHSLTDQLCLHVDRALRTLWGVPLGSERANPSDAVTEPVALSPEETALSVSLMRVNHAGEVCAQALYQGQALTSRDTELKNSLAQAALEENDHLLWCQNRIAGLGGHTSYLNPLWYVGSLSIGAMCGLVGERFNLSFLAETERQVVAHLDKHLQLLPSNDTASRAILTCMREDELTHQTTAMNAGAIPLTTPLPTMMQATARIMTTLAYYV